MSVFTCIITITWTDHRHIWHRLLVGSLPTESSAPRDTRSIPVGNDGFPFACTTCPLCAQTIATGFLECPACDTRFYYTTKRPPRVSTVANPEGRKRAGAARHPDQGSTRSHMQAGKMTANAEAEDE